MKEEMSDRHADTDVSLFLDDNDPIPFKFLTMQIYVNLSNKLDRINEVAGNDWRMLAQNLGYDMEEILNFPCRNSVSTASNTVKVLQDYCGRQDSTVNKLYKALEELNRQDVLDVLKEGLPDVRRSHQASLRKKHSHHEMMTEHSCACPSCETGMPLPNDHFNSCYMDQKKCMNSMNGYPIINSHHPMAVGNKHYQRHKSMDNSYMARSRGYEHMSPEFKRFRSVQEPDSMAVRGHDSRSQFIREYEPMDQSQIVREDPVSPAHVMMRDRQLYNHPAGLPASISGMCRSNNYESAYRPQHGPRPGLKLEIPSPMDGYKHHFQNSFCSPSPTPTTPSTPLLQLTKLANEKKFQPDESYDDLMRLKQEGEADAILASASELQAQMEDMERMGTSPSHHHHIQGASHMKERPPIKMEDCGSRPKANEPPNTFPLRLKSSCSSSNSIQLSKSVSVPNNMKPAEFKKAFRHIKVFVTYAADDKKHTQRVINLCKCLVKNGFTCCVDIFSKSLHDEDPVTWCLNRFEEADFILAVISPKYRREADSCEMDNDADASSDSMDEDVRLQGPKAQRLHTKQIYRLMYREYLHNSQRNGRFVPLLFQGMTRDLIPDWMLDAYGKLVYVWPQQYKDLLWMLTKPEHRVPEHIAPVINRSIRNSDEKENGDGLDLGQESE